MITRWRISAFAACLLAASSGSAQPPARLATTPAALSASPVFYHGKQVAVVGTITENRDLFKLEPTSGPGFPAPPVGGRTIYVYWRERPTKSEGEVRGEFWDLGRITEGDTRFTSYDFRPLLEATSSGRWPGRDQVFVILGASLVEATFPDTPTLRALVLTPERYENRSVKISGRFRGRNLHADLAGPVPSATKWDFVLQSADASVWISGLRPRGRGFELDPSARVDTGKRVQVAGTLRRDGSRIWVEARDIELAGETDDAPVEVELPPPPKEPPPTVVFSAPVPDEPEVDTSVIVRIQFSRDMDARSFKDRVRIGYAGTPPAGQPPPAPPTWSFNYNVGSRGVEIKFGKPLERFQTVKVELLEGIKAIDGEPLQPWALTFATGR
jgi:Bacterial Ig-like domain